MEATIPVTGKAPRLAAWGAVVGVDAALFEEKSKRGITIAPTITTGDTELDIAVANSINALIPGDTVSLVSAVVFDPTSQDHYYEQPAACTLASQAMSMETKARQDGNSTERKLLTVALDPQSAIREKTAGESGAIIAVLRYPAIHP